VRFSSTLFSKALRKTSWRNAMETGNRGDCHMYHTAETVSCERSTFQRLCSSVCSKTTTCSSRGTQGCAQAMRRNRPDVNAAPRRPKCRHPIKPYPGQNVLTNHSVQQPFRRRNHFERYLHTCGVAVTSTRKPCFAAGCRENRRRRLCGGQLCNIYFRVPGTTEHSSGTL
jgi:hypothetical protein